MTEKGTKTLIGFFGRGALTLMIGGVMIVGSGSFSSAARFVCFFDASLRGLLPGSPVYFRGVRVGKVVSIQINADADELTFRTPVVIELEKSALKSSHADLASLLSRGSADTSLLTDLVRKAWKEHTWKGFLSIEMACLDSRERLFEVMGWICEGRNS